MRFSASSNSLPASPSSLPAAALLSGPSNTDHELPGPSPQCPTRPHPCKACPFRLSACCCPAARQAPSGRAQRAEAPLTGGRAASLHPPRARKGRPRKAHFGDFPVPTAPLSVTSYVTQFSPLDGRRPCIFWSRQLAAAAGWQRRRRLPARQAKARPGEARQAKGEARRGKASQGEARRARQAKARPGEARPRRGPARRGMTRRGPARQG